MSDRPISQHGLSVVLPAGWDGVIYRRPAPRVAHTQAVLHAASFPLPPQRGDYGSGAVERMGPADTLVAMLEFDPASAGRPLFAGNHRPPGLSARELSAQALQRPIPGHAGLQRFFTENGRAFCLYVVVGSFLRAGSLLPAVNQMIQRLQISPATP